MTRRVENTTQPTRDLPLSDHGARIVAVVDGRAQSWDVPLGRWIVIGRDPQCDVQVEHAGLSRRHARLKLGVHCEIEDLGSANGTHVGERRLDPHVAMAIPPGSPIALGPVLIVSVHRADSIHERSPSMAVISQWVERVADSDLPVMLIGETGVGKTRLAREIHERSSRRGRPFVVVDCAALADDLIEDTLFGHVRGAFTGAAADREGALEAASGGTLLLDEIAELPTACQGKLLRAVQDGEIVRLGSNEVRAIDARFIAATHRSLDQALALAEFRSDLYHRLAGLVLRLPALRERSDETGALCDALVSELRDKLAKPDLEVTADGRDWIARQAWPGNIRELRNVLHRAAVLHGEPRLDASSLARFASPEPAMQSQGGSEGATELRSERERITDALERCGGNQTRAARMLGMTRRQLVYRIAGYGLPRPRGDGTKDDA